MKSPRERKTGFRERSKARPRRKVILSTNAAGKIGMQGGKAPNLTPCTTTDSRWLADSVKLKTRKLPEEKLERIFVLLGKDYLEATANG